MSICTIPRFLSARAGFIVIVCLSRFKFCSALCSSGVRFEGLVWHRVGGAWLKKSSIFVVSWLWGGVGSLSSVFFNGLMWSCGWLSHLWASQLLHRCRRLVLCLLVLYL